MLHNNKLIQYINDSKEKKQLELTAEIIYNTQYKTTSNIIEMKRDRGQTYTVLQTMK